MYAIKIQRFSRKIFPMNAVRNATIPAKPDANRVKPNFTSIQGMALKCLNAISENLKIDLKYKRNLIEAAGLPEIGVNSLKSVLGPMEFKSFVAKNSENARIYAPGIRPADKKGVADSFPLTNVKNKTFGANLHIHTTNSDGKLSVQELLDQASEYANAYFKKNKTPFVIAITDHNTVEGCKEAVQILGKNPEKYKNLRVVLGAEISVKEDSMYGYAFKKPEKFHILTMCINPFEKHLNDFIADINMGHKTPMFPRVVRLDEVVSAVKHQPDAYLSYAHPAFPDMKHRIVNPNDDYTKLNQDCVRFFKEKAGDKALYAEVYYGGYKGSMATDEKLHDCIKSAVEDAGLLKAGGMDTHGDSIFYSGINIK